MEVQCSRCNQSALLGQSLCARCYQEQRTGKLVVGIIIGAILGVIVIAIFVLYALSTSENSMSRSVATPSPLINIPINNNNPVQDTPAPNNNTTPSPTASPGTAINSGMTVESLNRYSEKALPIISDVRAEMSGTVLDLRQFLKDANTVKGQENVRRVIDTFREQLKGHDQRLGNLYSTWQNSAPPQNLANQHERFATAIKKYQTAVKSYIAGLAAYNFTQIRSSQTELETADSEIKLAAEELQKAISNI